MLSRALCYFIAVFAIFCLSFGAVQPENWGFFAHKRINRLAVFTLPSEMMGFYKQHIEYITDHAVDADKRRYLIAAEAPRHFIDLDAHKVNELPSNWSETLLYFSTMYLVKNGDTTEVHCSKSSEKNIVKMTFSRPLMGRDSIFLATNEVRGFFTRTILPQYYRAEKEIAPDSIKKMMLPIDPNFTCQSAFFIENISKHGILPYHLARVQRQLTEAFKSKNVAKILKISADLGHYIGDAHVPLHTTQNYNGQLTNQDGIHAFWESRLPELFADETYDFFVGKAIYHDEMPTFFWSIIQKSHTYKDTLLSIERDLSTQFSSDKKYCFEQRGAQLTKTQCSAYAEAYHQKLQGQVESQMRAAILALGTAWYTAWVDAGSPDLSKLPIDNSTPIDTSNIKTPENTQMIGRQE
jgi:hypothetical protein